jgi:hypothetical protein
LKKSLLPSIRPTIRREHAETYLFLLLISFAISVSGTRFFLQLTGFPRIGGGELHIAHVLWGGLILFAATLLPLLFANQWAFYFSAIGSGFGMGLFIDEVGKFITSSNDYFYPAAAPVIYVFFLIVVLVYLRIKKPVPRDTRTQLYQVFEDFQEVLDNDLSLTEKMDLEKRLEYILANSDRQDLSLLAVLLQNFLNHPELFLVPENPSKWSIFKEKVQLFYQDWLTPPRVQAGLAGGLITWSLWTLAAPFKFMIYRENPVILLQTLTPFITGRMIRGNLSLDLYMILLGLQAATGMIILFCTFTILINCKVSILNILYFVLLISLTILTPLLFYYDQFSTIIAASLQFFLLLVLMAYRGMLKNKSSKC